MELIIKGTPEEIAALVVAVQERQKKQKNPICETGSISREQLEKLSRFKG